jgi:hypothetical protein
MLGPEIVVYSNGQHTLTSRPDRLTFLRIEKEVSLVIRNIWGGGAVVRITREYGPPGETPWCW